MFYSSTFAPAIERDSGDEMLRKIKKLFEKNFEKYLELNNKSCYLCIRVCLTIANKSSLKKITYQQVVQERRSIKRYTVKDYNKVRDSERRY